LLKDGNTITGIDPVSIDKMFEKTQTAINSVLDSLQSITEDKGIKLTINNLTKFSTDLNVISKELRKTVADGRMDRISKKLDNTLTSLEKISKTLENGEGALGKLILDKQVENNLKDTIHSLRVFSKMMEDAPSKWIVDDKKAKDVRSELEREDKKNK
jgi:hypothetical protein